MKDFISKDILVNTANAIRACENSNNTIAPKDFADRIRALDKLVPQPDALNFYMPNGGTIALNKIGNPTQVELEYSIDRGRTWITWQEDNDGNRELTITKEQKVFIRNTSETSTGFSTSSSNYYNFAFTADTYVGGNTNSLLCKIPSNAVITSYCYCYMFHNCNSLTMNDTFTLPSTTLAPSCYYYMFSNCTNLTMSNTFALPATILSSYCYSSMFSSCTNLTMNDSFTLPATILALSCYNRMFNSCVSLTMNNIFILPATTLTDACYAYMFNACTNINLVKTNMTDISAANCLTNWLSNASTTGDLYCPAELTIPIGASGIPTGWTRHNIGGEQYLNFTMPNGGTITLTKNGNPTEVTLEYLIEGEPNWITWTETNNVRSLTLNAGEKVYIRNASETSTGFSTSDDYRYDFAFTADTHVGGNVNSLLCKIPSNAVITDYCYNRLFRYCPQLILSNTFSLPSTTLASDCYNRMFYGCSNLTMNDTFTLPTTTLANRCYYGMFAECPNINLIRTNMTDISANNCLLNWLLNVSPTGDFYCPAELTIPSSSSGIPNGWTRHDI